LLRGEKNLVAAVTMTVVVAVHDFAAMHDSVAVVQDSVAVAVVATTPVAVVAVIAVVAAVAPEGIAEPRVVRSHAAMVVARPAAMATASPAQMSPVVMSRAEYSRAMPLRGRVHACAEDEHEQDN
jgi:hypothetical protein